MARESDNAPDSGDTRDDAIAGARDFMHGFVDRVGAALGVDTNTRDDDDGATCTSHSGRASHMPTLGTSAPIALPLPAALALPPAKRAWEIVELKSGACVVTNGMQTAACPSRVFAESLLVELARQGGTP